MAWRSIICLTLACFLAAPSARAAPKAKLWARWTTTDESATASVDHGNWQRFLQTYVTADGMGINRIAYGKVAPPDHAALDGYIATLAAVPVSGLRRTEQRAFWINLYNALTVKVILDHYPVASIRDIDISPGFFSNGPWGKKLVAVEGEPVSLDDIEHRILRPIWKDPRIHYAVNCAAVGCPNLRQQAFTADNAEELLNAGAQDYVNHPRGARVVDGELVVSSIYTWFQEDFGGNDAGVIAHLKIFAEEPLRAALDNAGDIDGNDYDWRLNEAK